MRKGLFVVCEGLDCSGKTTTIKYAIERLREEGIEVSYNKGLKTDNFFGRISSMFPSTLTLLIELLYVDYKIVRPMLERGETVVQDRWYYSVLSHNPKNKVDSLLGKIFAPLLSKPDAYVHFTVSLEERVRRLKDKEKSKDHLILIETPRLIEEKERRYVNYYNGFSGKKEIVDTTRSSVEESGYKIEEVVKEYNQGRIHLIS